MCVRVLNDCERVNNKKKERTKERKMSIPLRKEKLLPERIVKGIASYLIGLRVILFLFSLYRFFALM